MYAAAHFLYTTFGGSNAAVDAFLARVGAPPWKVAQGSWFWKLLMSIMKAAEITVLDEAVVHYRSGWRPGGAAPHILLDLHTGIFLTAVDWNLLVILVLFSDGGAGELERSPRPRSVLAHGELAPKQAEMLGIPSQLAGVYQELVNTQRSGLVPAEFL